MRRISRRPNAKICARELRDAHLAPGLVRQPVRRSRDDAGKFPVTYLGPKPERVTRIVSLAPSVTEILFALGAGPAVVGVTRFDKYPPQVEELPRVGGFVDPDIEAIVALRPDLVVTVPTSGGRSRVDTLARLNVPVLVVPSERMEDLFVAVDALGVAVGRQGAAKSFGTILRQAIAKARERHAKLPVARALVLLGHRPLVAAGPGSYVDSLLEVLHADNVVGRGGAFPRLDLEAAAALEPQVVVDLSHNQAEARAALESLLRRTGSKVRISHLESEPLLRPGPRLPQALEELSRALRPLEAASSRP